MLPPSDPATMPGLLGALAGFVFSVDRWSCPADGIGRLARGRLLGLSDATSSSSQSAVVRRGQTLPRLLQGAFRRNRSSCSGVLKELIVVVDLHDAVRG